MKRYAIYFAPAQHTELTEFGRLVLSASTLLNDSPVRLSVTRKAAFYGFHSTFKAPMELATGVDEQALLDAMEAFVKTRRKLPLIGLAPRTLDGFHALTLAEADAINDVAGDVVKTFERFRAPLSEYDRQRRDPNSLSAQQLQNLDTYGYPHVLDEFRFHMTLSHRMTDPVESSDYHQWLVSLYSDTVTETPVFDQLALFMQPDREHAFTRVAEFPVN